MQTQKKIVPPASQMQAIGFVLVNFAICWIGLAYIAAN